MNTLSAIGSAAGMLIRRRAAPGGAVLGYHDVVDSGAHGLCVTTAALRAHIRLLRALGMRIAPLDELRQRIRAGASTDGLAALTFDDALVGVHRRALAVLEEEDAPATVFAVSEHCGVSPPWWPGAARTMTRRELRDLLAAGHTLEAHTCSHPSLPRLDDTALEHELRASRERIQDIAGSPVHALAYPSGHHDPRVRAAARAAGYQIAFTFLNGRLTGAEDPFRLPRLTMTARSSPARLTYHLTRPARTWPDHQQSSITGSAAS